MEYPRAYKWNIIEYPLKYDIIFHLGLPQEYAYSYSPRRPLIGWTRITLLLVNVTKDAFGHLTD